jgi:hypothetical protein
MKRNILDLRPDANIVLDVDKIIYVDVYKDEKSSDWVIRLFIQERQSALLLSGESSVTTFKIFNKITDRMIQ